MAFDSKRLRMFKWLESLASNKASYSKGVYNSIKDIVVYCGSIYATNGLILAKVDYPEFEHLSDWEWSKITRFVDDNGLLLETPEIEERAQFKDNRIFDSWFLDSCEPIHAKIDPRILADAIKPFSIYKLDICFTTGRDKLMLSGHDKDVSLRVLMMGKVYKYG